MAGRRRFSKREKAALYDAADGRCQCWGCGACGPDGCEAELSRGWHADHDDPHSRGGETDLVNGRALCPPCNLSKGSRVLYRDAYTPRPFQREVINAVLDGMASGRDTTIVLASPGSGKTLAYQAAATFAYREGLADLVAVFVPRIVLAQQCETSWLNRKDDGTLGGNHLLFDARSRLGRIRHVANQAPLTMPGESGIGFVTTYSALVSNPPIFDSWARHHKGRFLLIADEAQFCGAANDNRGEGTRAGALITDVHAMAAHTLLLTGTPYRSDGQPLILADYDEPDEQGRRQLLSHVPPADYRAGVREGYLRRFEATLHDARIRWKRVDNTVTEYDLSVSGDDLADVLRKEDVWRPIADGVVAAVREKQRANPEYRGLISCMEQKDAGRVYDYLTKGNRYPGLRVLKATTEDGKDAERDLRKFQARNGGDILVTVRKAFIGYDCPQITVVGILTHYRDQGHLEQLVGRGLRTWSGAASRSQSCRVIAPDDPKMTEFIEYMRGESEQGLRERRAREQKGEGPGTPDDGQMGYVESAHATTARAVSNDTSLDNEQLLLIEAVKHDVGSSEDVTVLARFAEKLGLALPQASVADIAPEPGDAAPLLTEREQIESIGAQVVDEVKRVLSAQGVGYPRSDYDDHVRRVTAQVNKLAGCRAPECRTVEQAMARLRVVREMRERVS